MQEIFQSIELEFTRLKDKVSLTENQFFVILSDENIQNHEKDVGLIPDLSADLDTRRGRVMSKLRGTGTVTKTMMKNVALSFVNGEIEIEEFPSEYCFAVKFTSRTGIPYNIEDIKAMIEEIKPAHLAVEYIFTYRLWKDILTIIQNWLTASNYTWDWLLTFEVPVNLYIDENNNVSYVTDDSGNGQVIWDGTSAYARRTE